MANTLYILYFHFFSRLEGRTNYFHLDRLSYLIVHTYLILYYINTQRNNSNIIIIFNNQTIFIIIVRCTHIRLNNNNNILIIDNDNMYFILVMLSAKSRFAKLYITCYSEFKSKTIVYPLIVYH